MPPTETNSLPPPGPNVVAADEPVAMPAVAVGRGRLWAWAIGAGLAAGLTAWLGGEVCRELIKPSRHAVNSRGLVLKVTDRRGEAVAEALNAGVAFVVLGAALGAGMGVAGGLARRSARAARSSGLHGLAMGAVATAATSLVLIAPYTAYKQRDPDAASRDMFFPLMVHAGIWSAAGAAGGLAFARGLGARGSMLRAVEGGLAGASVAAVAYELIGAIAFPGAMTSQFVSATWPTRLMARLGVTVLAAAGAAMGVSDLRNKSK